MADTQLAVRITPAQEQQLDALVAELTARSLGAEITKSHVCRLALDLGLPALAKKIEKAK
jgi:hypothetical protein